MRQVRRRTSTALVLGAAATLLAACGTTGTTGSGTPTSAPVTSSQTATPSTPASSTPASSTPTPSTPSPSTGVPTAASLRVAPGRVGRAVVSMSEQQALATGYFVHVDPSSSSTCATTPSTLTWREPLSGVLRVGTTSGGAIASMTVRAAGPTTSRGLGVGSTLAQVSAVYETARLTEAGHHQTGVFVSDGRAWLGFLFDQNPADVARTDKVVLMQVTRSELPTLIADDDC